MSTAILIFSLYYALFCENPKGNASERTVNQIDSHGRHNGIAFTGTWLYPRHGDCPPFWGGRCHRCLLCRFQDSQLPPQAVRGRLICPSLRADAVGLPGKHRPCRLEAVSGPGLWFTCTDCAVGFLGRHGRRTFTNLNFCTRLFGSGRPIQLKQFHAADNFSLFVFCHHDRICRRNPQCTRTLRHSRLYPGPAQCGDDCRRPMVGSAVACAGNSLGLGGVTRWLGPVGLAGSCFDGCGFAT